LMEIMLVMSCCRCLVLSSQSEPVAGEKDRTVVCSESSGSLYHQIICSQLFTPINAPLPASHSFPTWHLRLFSA
jgi:hypothetical protein